MSSVLDLKAFVPARNFQQSLDFYQGLGFSKNWRNERLAELQIDEYRILLQDFYDEGLAANLMLQLLVPDTDHWWQRIEETGLLARFPGAGAQPPEIQPWGQKVLYLWDVAGVLWHIAEPIESGQ